MPQPVEAGTVLSVLRKLSPVERFACRLGQEEPICFAMTARLRGPISLDLLERALRKVRERHPLAAVRVVNGPANEPWFESAREDDVPLDVIEDGAREPWTEVVPRELARLSDPYQDPMVRFVWIKGETVSDLVVVCHHAVADGLSAAYLIRDVLGFLQDPDAAVAPLPLTQAMEDLIPRDMEKSLSGSILTDLKHVLTKGLPGRLDEKTPKDPKFRLLSAGLDSDETALLVRRSHEQDSSVQGAIGAAFLIGFAGVQRKQAGSTRTLQSPVNLRPWLSPPVGEGFGFFVNQVQSTVDCAPGDFWDVARQLKADLAAKSRPDFLFRQLVQLKQVLKFGIGFDILYQASKGRSWGRGHDVTVSNIGRLDFPSAGGPDLVSLHGPTFSAMRNGKLVGVCTANGELTMTFLHEQAGMQPELADAVFTGALQRIRHAIS